MGINWSQRGWMLTWSIKRLPWFENQVVIKKHQSQILISLSQVDTEPLSIIEAMGHGVPALSYRYSYGPEELIRDGQNGYLCHQSSEDDESL
ncbi:glycosyltransferase [Furfurilactobacillus entadae]|uniref:glycosyltransferase n=1 Tax=Furfurilactobacillus entadae TaxID=2922307 RepID=UPI0038B34A4E